MSEVGTSQRVTLPQNFGRKRREADIQRAALTTPDLWVRALARSTLWIAFIIGSLAVAALLVGAIVVASLDDDPAAKWRRRSSGFRNKIIKRSLFVLVILGLAAWHFLPLDPLLDNLPGFSVYSLLIQYDVPDFQRRYLFQLGSESGPRLELFISASNLFTFSVTDSHGENYPLEMNIGKDIPLHQLVGILTEVGVTPYSTILRVAVNGKEVARRTLRSRIDISGSIVDGHLGSNEKGEQHGNFLLKRLVIWQVAVSNEGVSEIDATAKKQNE